MIALGNIVEHRYTGEKGEGCSGNCGQRRAVSKKGERMAPLFVINLLSRHWRPRLV